MAGLMGDYFSRGLSSRAHNPDGSVHSGRSNEIPPTPPPIRLRRLPSTYEQSALRRVQEQGNDADVGRRRSMSAPQQRPDLTALGFGNDLRRQQTATQYDHELTPVREETSANTPHEPMPPLPGTENEAARAQESSQPAQEPAPRPVRPGRRRAASSMTRSILTRSRSSFMRSHAADNRNAHRESITSHGSLEPPREYEQEIVDLLDVIDPEVATLTTMNNIQNSLFIPYLGRYVNRTATYDLTRVPSVRQEADILEEEAAAEPMKEKEPVDHTRARDSTISSEFPQSEDGDIQVVRTRARNGSISSVVRDDKYAVLPHGTTLRGWSPEDVEELNDHVRHMLHSRRAGFKRSMKGFWRYFRTPMGFFVTTYAFLITFWGAAWVIFLIGWINVGDRRAYFIEICDQILTAMLCVFGIGLAPFRCVDTYHLGFIAYYHRLTWRMRKAKSLPELNDPNDLPDFDIEGMNTEDPDAVLTPKQNRIFKHHQAKFAKSHTYYRPHETYTHRAFPLWCLITIVALLDAHSCFQIALGGTTWGIYYRKRGHILTTVILCCSLTCNITGGIMVSVGDKLTRKKEIREQMFRQALTADAMKKMQKKKGLALPEVAAPAPEPEKKKQKKSWWKRSAKEGEDTPAASS